MSRWSSPLCLANRDEDKKADITYLCAGFTRVRVTAGDFHRGHIGRVSHAGQAVKVM